MLRFVKMFIFANLAILVILLFLPAILIITDVPVIDTLIDYLTN